MTTEYYVCADCRGAIGVACKTCGKKGRTWRDRLALAAVTIGILLILLGVFAMLRSHG
jgi:hypothetical protein